jgi:hypothetical protein
LQKVGSTITSAVVQEYRFSGFDHTLGSFCQPLENHMSFQSWIKRLGFWGFLFFLVKGLLWLTIPALIAILAN